MENENCDYGEDKNFGDACDPLFKAYYKSLAFIDKVQTLRKRGAIFIDDIDFDRNTLFQTKTYLDAIISLSCGSALQIDNKAERTFKDYMPAWLDTFAIEAVSNPNKGYKHDGWGYHVGTTIVKMKVVCFDDVGSPLSPKDYYMAGTPCIFTISDDFIDSVTNNQQYPFHPNKKTNGLYRSGWRAVPRDVLEKYFGREDKEKSPMNVSADRDWSQSTL